MMLDAAVCPELRDPLKLSVQPCNRPSVAERDRPPKTLRGYDWPEAAQQQLAGIVAGEQQKLIARDPPDGIGMPASERCTAAMACDGFRHVQPAEAERGTAKGAQRKPKHSEQCDFHRDLQPRPQQAL